MTTEAEAIAELAKKSVATTTIETKDGRELLLTAKDVTITDISDEHHLSVTNPRYIEQVITLQTSESLVEYVRRYKGDNTLLFADIASNKIVAAIDYHERDHTAMVDHAAMVAHRAMLVLHTSEEWRLWNGISGGLSPQLEFARFIEENAADIKAPDAASLLESVRDLQAHRKVNFTKAVRTSSENETFEYTDETKATSKRGIELPTQFKLGIPVYFGEQDTELYAFLRWAIKAEEGVLNLGVHLHRAEHVRQAVFKQIVGVVSAATGCPAVFGSI
jgi:uncharacterized protein YfdQ (DUF2303 family)